MRVNGNEANVTVVVAEPGDSHLLGATALESLGFSVDPIARRLIPQELVAMYTANRRLRCRGPHLRAKTAWTEQEPPGPVAPRLRGRVSHAQDATPSLNTRQIASSTAPGRPGVLLHAVPSPNCLRRPLSKSPEGANFLRRLRNLASRPAGYRNRGERLVNASSTTEATTTGSAPRAMLSATA